MPELYPGQNQADSVEIAQEPLTTSDGGHDLHDDFLDAGRISLEQSDDVPQDAAAQDVADTHDKTGMQTDTRADADGGTADEANPGR
jgi:hypothetical protein